MLRAWTDTFCVQRVTKWTFEGPLFKNPLLNLPPMILASVGGQFRRAGLTKLGHLRRVDGGGWRTADDIAAQSPLFEAGGEDHGGSTSILALLAAEW